MINGVIIICLVTLAIYSIVDRVCVKPRSSVHCISVLENIWTVIKK